MKRGQRLQREETQPAGLGLKSWLLRQTHRTDGTGALARQFRTANDAQSGLAPMASRADLSELRMQQNWTSRCPRSDFEDCYAEYLVWLNERRMG
jgi:hypothetical protein